LPSVLSLGQILVAALGSKRVCSLFARILCYLCSFGEAQRTEQKKNQSSRSCRTAVVHIFPQDRTIVVSIPHVYQTTMRMGIVRGWRNVRICSVLLYHPQHNGGGEAGCVISISLLPSPCYLSPSSSNSEASVTLNITICVRAFRGDCPSRRRRQQRRTPQHSVARR